MYPQIFFYKDVCTILPYKLQSRTVKSKENPLYPNIFFYNYHRFIDIWHAKNID